MTVIYVYDLEGWALHAIGDWLARSLSTGVEDFRVMSYAAWRANPARCDVLCLSYSGLIDPDVDYHRWADRVVSTIHDPCELSFFEHRGDWATLPLRPLAMEGVDQFSVSSEELLNVLRMRYGMTPLLTPTWSLRCETLRAARRPQRDQGGCLHAVSSTNVPMRRPLKDVLRRLTHPKPYLRDERGNLSLRQLSAVAIRRRRKRVEWLVQIADALHDQPGISCDFVTGRSAKRPAAVYEAALLGADVYVCTSTMEGGPLPVLEAVMAGAAVLSTPVGQVPRWIEHGGSGFFCASPAEFVDRLRAYDADRALLHRHQQRARELADTLTPDLSTWRRLLFAESADGRQ